MDLRSAVHPVAILKTGLLGLVRGVGRWALKLCPFTGRGHTGHGMEIGWHHGDRMELWDSFVLAEDSTAQLSDYIHSGRVLIAREDHGIVGHLQLTPTDRDGELEINSLAVAASYRGHGVGAALVARAFEVARAERWQTLVVSTGAADIGNLRFYQRVGFRMLRVQRDAFTAATGYPDPIDVDGILLRDAVWFSAEVWPGQPAEG